MQFICVGLHSAWIHRACVSAVVLAQKVVSFGNVFPSASVVAYDFCIVTLPCWRSVSVVNHALEFDCTTTSARLVGGGDGSSNAGGHPLNRWGGICFLFCYL